ncbi:MAG: hypothetical protein IV094_02050 [Vitreoscilla sp.]|nr:hypothetical protein [Vitreoscilla sp.]
MIDPKLPDTASPLADASHALMDRASEQASALAQRGIDAVRDSSRMIRGQAQHASDSTVNYIRNEPIKATLIAAATGAALMLLIGLLTRPHERR